jgi:hypothetical protein
LEKVKHKKKNSIKNRVLFIKTLKMVDKGDIILQQFSQAATDQVAL